MEFTRNKVNYKNSSRLRSDSQPAYDKSAIIFMQCLRVVVL